jgi:hypothetical protein
MHLASLSGKEHESKALISETEAHPVRTIFDC